LPGVRRGVSSSPTAASASVTSSLRRRRDRPLYRSGKLDVLGHRHPGEQRSAVLLEDHRHTGRWAVHRPALDRHLARRRLQQAGQAFQQGCSCHTRRAHQACELTGSTENVRSLRASTRRSLDS
jgi:hypothetical protein